jgi:DNA-binding NtrC family response regulator
MSEHAIDEVSTAESPEAAQKLLVIDDDTVHRMVLARIARQAGYEVDLAPNYETACRLVAESTYACVTVDLSLGAYGGLEVFKVLAEAKFDAPIIVVSGSDDVVREEALIVARRLKLNLCGCFGKPINLSRLRELLQDIRKRQVVGLTPRGA